MEVPGLSVHPWLEKFIVAEVKRFSELQTQELYLSP